jgi:sorbitol-specific phosphotransferase system component IIBC
MGTILMPNANKYKSIGVSVDTYNKIVEIASKERRNISQQLSLLVDAEYMDQGFKASKPAKVYAGGLSSVIED